MPKSIYISKINLDRGLLGMILTVAEFAYKACEKGHNLEWVRIEIKKYWKETGDES